MKTIILFLGGVGMQELLIIGLFVLIFFGAKKIPEFMRSMGKGVNEFKKGVSDAKREIEEQDKDNTDEAKTESRT